MTKISKRVKNIQEKVDKTKMYSLSEAVDILKEVHSVKFDETVEYHANLGVDPKYADQMIRGTLSLPAGTGKEIKVMVFAESENATKAKEAGADYVGSDDMIEKIQKEGFLDFDVVIATPDMMRKVSKLGKVLGPRGLMPNPKLGTVTKDVEKAVKEFKAGKLEYKVDKFGNMHISAGKLSFDKEKIVENFVAVHNEILKAKPVNLKGAYLKRLYISSTMGPGIRLDPASIVNK